MHFPKKEKRTELDTSALPMIDVLNIDMYNQQKCNVKDFIIDENFDLVLEK